MYFVYKITLHTNFMYTRRAEDDRQVPADGVADKHVIFVADQS